MNEDNKATCVCGGGNYRLIKRLYKSNKKYLLLECKECGLISTTPIPKKTIGGSKYLLNKVDNISLWEIFAGRLLGIIGECRDKEDTKILEIGSNIGIFLKVAKEQGWDARGIDIDNEASRIAKEKFGIDTIRADITKADLPKESFDVIVMAHVLEHIFEPDKLLASIKNLLRTGGILVIEVPNVNGLPVIIQNFRGKEWYGYDPERHVWHFNPRNITKLLERNGYFVDKLVTNIPMYYEKTGYIHDLARSAVLKLSIILNMADQIVVVATPKR